MASPDDDTTPRIVKCALVVEHRSVRVEPLTHSFFAPPLVHCRQEESVSVGPARKKAKNDLPEIAKIKNSDTRTKFNILKGHWGQKASWKQPLTPGADSFRKQFLNPTMLCLQKHFACSVDAFVAKYPAYEYTKFAVYCNGKGHSCAPMKK